MSNWKEKQPSQFNIQQKIPQLQYTKNCIYKQLFLTIKQIYELTFK